MTEVVKQPDVDVPSPDHHEDTPSDPLPPQRPGTPSLVYQLRRIGAEASIEGIKDVFKLTKPRTILGRNASDVDCFVDSSIHTRLISRQHAEILMEMDENKSPVLYVLDRSLNGTFVNDVKLTSQTKVQLKEGDTLTLGHLRGVQVTQGTFAEQPNSEFRFRLVYAPVEDDDATEDEENTPSKRKNKESPKVSKKTRILHPPDSNVNPPTSQSMNKPYSMPPPFLQNNRVDSNPSSSHQDNKGLDEEENTQPTMGTDSWRGKQKRGSGRGTARGSGRGRGSTRGLGHSRGRGRGQGDPERLGTGEQRNRETGNKAADEFEFEFESESGNEEDAALRRQVDAICEKSLSNSDSDSVKGRPGPSKPGPSRGKTSKNSRTSKPEPKRTDKKKGESAPTNQNTRKRRTAAAKKDDVEYNSQPCSSAKCIRPKNSMVSWVQCDDCDDWFHVTCVGCDYNKVKQADYQFHCGCKRKTKKK